ncbi:MAG: hypothetical protein ACRDRR_05875 [Pseudonocardiaceae bacterium]
MAIEQPLWTSSPTIWASPVRAGAVLAGRPDSGPVLGCWLAWQPAARERCSG